MHVKFRKSGKKLKYIFNCYGLFFLLLIFISPTQYLHPEDKKETQRGSASIKDEAPEAIFQTQLNDADVDLYMLGSWDSSFTGSIGYDLSSGEYISAPFPQMTPGLAFTQVPDLTISLWLMDRYFFEATIKEDSTQNTFLLGYEGKDDEFVQSVLIGNTKIDIEDYSFLTISSIPNNSLGASAAFKTENTWHELMVRYDPAELAVKEFIGKNEVNRQTFQPTDYFRGRLFILPDTDFENIEVYIENDDGSYTGDDGRRYKKADNTEAVISSDDGTVLFNPPLESRALVYYTKNGFPVGDNAIGKEALCEVDAGGTGTPDPSLGTRDFYWGLTGYPATGYNMAEKKITINGKDALLIYNRGEYSPFESLSYYQSEALLPDDRSKINFGISSKSSDSDVIDEKLKFRIEPEDNLVNVYVNANGVRDMYNRYPLFGKFLNPVYGISKKTVPGSFVKELRLETLSPVSSFMLDPDIVPGSVTVKRNGYAESMYDIDYASGIITFKTYIHPNDRIKVTYRTSYLDTEGGDLLFATGNRFFLGDYMTAELAFGIKWNVLQNQYSRYPEQYKGSLLTTGGLEYTRENFNLALDTGVSITSPDTTGILRLFDMQQSGITMRLGGSYIFPSSVPEDNSSIDSFPAERGNRGKLIFKDYYSYSLGSASLNNYTWNVPGSQIYNYGTGNPPGPYTAKASSDGIQGEILVMDMEVPNGDWAGAQVPLRKYSENQDLSSAESISFKIKCEDVSDGKLYIQIGTVNEDLDGDGILDSENSIYSDGFPFNDTGNSAVLLVGGIGGSTTRGNGSLDSEDNDLNKVLDREDSKNIVTKDLDDIIVEFASFTDIASSGKWIKINYNFTSAEKKLLTQSSAVRFIYVNESVPNVTGRILIGELFIESSPFSAVAATSAYAKEVYERYAFDEEPPEVLVKAYPEVEDIFFSDFDITSTQKVLESGWSGTGYTLTGFSSPVPYDMYRKLAGYIRLPAPVASNSEFTISYTDTAGRGIKATFTTDPFNDWRKFEIDLDRKRIYLAGVDMKGSVKVTSTDKGLSMLKITSDSDGGKLYLDEVHLTDPKISLSGAVATRYEQFFPGTLISARGVSIISDLTLKEDFLHAREDFSTDLSENTDANNTRTKTTVKTGILNSDLETNLDFSWVEPEFYSVIDHSYTSPLGTDFLTFSDYYSESKDEWNLSFSKRNELKAKSGDTGYISASAESYLLYSDLSQRWDFKYESDTYGRISGSSDLSLIKISSGYTTKDSWYMENWLNSFSLLAADNSDKWPDRSIEAENNITFKGESSGTDILIKNGTQSSGEEEDRSQTSTGMLQLQFPIYKKSIDGWEITPGYSRSFSYTNRDAPESSFLDDTALWFSDFAGQSYFYTGIPFAEFFSDGFEAAFEDKSSYLSKSTYTPAAFIKLTRGRRQRISDLYAPSELGFRYSKDFTKNEDTFVNIYRITGEYTARAINMFGSTGIEPVFDFYRTDEFITRLSVTASSTDTPVPQDREYAIGNSLYFSGHKDTEFIIDNKFRYVYSHSEDMKYFYDDASASYIWIRRPKERIQIKYLAEEKDDPAYFSHTESVIYSTAPESTLSEINYWSILLTHESALVFPEKGNFKAVLSIGMEKHKIYDYVSDEKNIYLLGIQAGIFGKVMF